MIVSHKHRFIFIKTQKTAGTSLEIALSALCGPDDIITSISPEDEAVRRELTLKGPQNDLIPKSRYSLKDWLLLLLKGEKARYYNHMPACRLRKIIPKDQWDSYFKFCFARNPWDRMASFYHWKKSADSFEDFVKSPVAGRLKGSAMYSSNGQILVDKVYCYEELEGALEDIARRLELGELELPEYRAKETQRPEYSSLYNKITRDLVAGQFAEEIERFSYTFESKNTNSK